LYLNYIHFGVFLAGDVVSKKKPDPEIYLLAMQKTGMKPENCVVIEDSKNGLMAAKGAKMNVIVTTNPYTEKEDLDQADIIITCLGDQEGDLGKLVKSNKPINFNGVLTLQQIKDYFSNH